MKYGTKMTTGAILMAFVAAAPLGVAEAHEKTQTTTQEAKTMVSDSWLTSKTKISLFADERVKMTQISVDTAKGVVHLRGKIHSAAPHRAPRGGQGRRRRRRARDRWRKIREERSPGGAAGGPPGGGRQR